MKRHRFDPISFVFGAMFLALAAAVALPDDPWAYLFDGLALGWVWPVVIIAVGVALLTGSMRREPASVPGPEDEPAEPTESQPD